MNKSKSLCTGCRNNFYNGNNNIGVAECWSYKAARVVTRYKVGWWAPTLRENFTQIKTLDCHHAPGSYALYEPEAWKRTPLS